MLNIYTKTTKNDQLRYLVFCQSPTGARESGISLLLSTPLDFANIISPACGIRVSLMTSLSYDPLLYNPKAGHRLDSSRIVH